MSILRSPFRWFAAATLAGVLLAWIGPFGSYLNPGPGIRLGYWVGAMWIGVLLYGVSLLVANRIAPPGSPARWPVLITGALVASLPEAEITRLVAFRLWPRLADVGPSWLLWYAQNATIGSIATIVIALTVDRTTQPPQPGPQSDSPSAPLPDAHDILALQMEDHYVRVHTSRGSSLVLMPLGRAIASAGIEGLRVHRSWWVARRAVVAVEGPPRAMKLRLTNGVVAPVARSAVAHVRAAGWLPN